MIHTDLTQWQCMNLVAIMTTRTNRQKVIPRGFLTINDICRVPQAWKAGIVLAHKEKSFVCLFKKRKDECIESMLTAFVTLGFVAYSLLKMQCKLTRPFCCVCHRHPLKSVEKKKSTCSTCAQKKKKKR